MNVLNQIVLMNQKNDMEKEISLLQQEFEFKQEIKKNLEDKIIQVSQQEKQAH
jgi:hypothetical protein